MRLEQRSLPQGELFALYRLQKDTEPLGTALLEGSAITRFEIAEPWRRHGYGSYLLRELLRRRGGYDRGAPSLFTAPLPADAGALAFAARFGFAVQGSALCRRRVPDLSAVELVHRALAAALAPGGFYLDATCGNGHDTLFLCGLAGPGGRVLGLDLQPRAVAATNALLTAHGCAQIGAAVCADHRELARYAPPGSADCVLFNFGWLPGAEHSVHSSAEGSLPALRAALAALKPGGVLAAVLYSGRVIGSAEKEAALALFKSLPIAEYTVLVCGFANWADTAPLPCLVFKKSCTPP